MKCEKRWVFKVTKNILYTIGRKCVKILFLQNIVSLSLCPVASPINYFFLDFTVFLLFVFSFLEFKSLSLTFPLFLCHLFFFTRCSLSHSSYWLVLKIKFLSCFVYSQQIGTQKRLYSLNFKNGLTKQFVLAFCSLEPRFHYLLL